MDSPAQSAGESVIEAGESPISTCPERSGAPGIDGEGKARRPLPNWAVAAAGALRQALRGHRETVLPFVLFALLGAASVGMWAAMTAHEERALWDVTGRQAEIAATRIQAIVDSRAAQLQILATRISHEGISEGRFDVLATRLREQYPGLTAIAWVDRNEALRSISPRTPLTIRLFGKGTAALRAASYSSEAGSTGHPAASLPFELDIGRRGFLMIVPVDGDKATSGTIGGAMLLRALADLALGDAQQSASFYTRVFDGDTLIYSNDRGHGGALAGKAGYSEIAAARETHVLNRIWTVVVFARPEYAASMRSHPEKTVLVGGLLLSAGVAWMYWQARVGRMQAEENRERFQDFAESSSDWLWETDAHGNIAGLSQRIEEHLGYSAASMIGQNQSEIPFPELNAPSLREAWREAVAQHRPLRDFICKMRSAAGKTVVVKLTGIPKFDRHGRFLGYRGSGADITAEQIAQENARKAQQRLYAAIEALPAAFLLYDPDGKLVLWNKYVDVVYPGLLAQLRTGMSHDEVARTVVQSLIPGDPHDKAEYMRRRIAKFQHANSEDEITLNNGHVLRVLDWRTSDGSIVGLRFDITEAKLREAELRQAQKMEAVGQLTGGIAHDFNNMLQVVAGYAELAKSEVGPAHAATASIQAIGDATNRAAELTRQLLSFSRKQSARKTDVDLNDIVRGITKLMGRLLAANMELRAQASEQALPVIADRGMIEQVLMNLAVNSRDAMPEGGQIVLETFCSALEDGFCRANPWAKPGRYATLRFSDTGSGMTREVMQHAFEPFFTTKGVGKGTGLGLSTVYGIVQQHDGLIHVDSEPGKGTTFHIYLPLAQLSVIETPLQSAAEAPGGNETVLVAEDEPSIRKLVSCVLEQKGYRVIVAQDGTEALALFSAHREQVRLVILDMIMPVLGGRGIYHRLRQLNSTVPVLISSGLADAADEEFARREQIQVLHKPYGAGDLLRAVRKALG